MCVVLSCKSPPGRVSKRMSLRKPLGSRKGSSWLDRRACSPASCALSAGVAAPNWACETAPMCHTRHSLPQLQLPHRALLHAGSKKKNSTLRARNSAVTRSARLGAEVRQRAAASGLGAGRSRNRSPVTDPSASSRTHAARPPSSSATLASAAPSSSLVCGRPNNRSQLRMMLGRR